ncbi:hypothetical protein BY996DRAFT_6419556 [Phakopsora pachyrhizi]|nr:hypothetical protein BY996DRAFT_6419556 [Phakopsora pachyrhizi]
MVGAAIVAIALSIEQSVVSFKIGDVVPSDCWLYDAINVSIDQAALNVALAVGAQQLAKYKDIVTQITAVDLCRLQCRRIDNCTEITYINTASGRMRCVSKGMTGAIINLCSCNKTKALESRLEGDVEEFAQRALNGCKIFGSKVPAVKIGYVKVPVKQLAYEALAQMIGASGVPLSQQVFGGNIQDYQSNLGLSLLSNDIGTLNGLPLLNNPELATQVLLAKELAEKHGEEDDQAVKKDLEKDQAETD